MKCKEFTTKSGKFIHVYDGLFSYAEMEHFYNKITTSIYKWGGGDGPMSETHNQLYAHYSPMDLKQLEFTTRKGYAFLQSKYKLKSTEMVRLNLSTPFESSSIHTDNTKGITLLYYVNLKWEINWNGHTLFMDDKLEEPEYLCLYKPGRVVLFNCDIPHMIMTQVPKHRFSFVMQFNDA